MEDSKGNNPIGKLNQSNYYSNNKYMSYSQFKGFEECEAKEMARDRKSVV